MEVFAARHWTRARIDSVVLAEDAVAAARLLDIGEVDLGVLYATDVVSRRELVVVESLDEVARVWYEAAMVRDTPAVRSVFDRLCGESARTRLLEAGFIAPEAIR